MESNIEPGDVVELLSGSTQMTVAQMNGGVVCRCQWVDSKGVPREEVYQAVTLKLVRKRLQ